MWQLGSGLVRFVPERRGKAGEVRCCVAWMGMVGFVQER